MKKVSRRAVAVSILAAALTVGLLLYIVNYFSEGAAWAAFSANRHIYSGGVLTAGRVLDRDGQILAETSDGIRTYNEDKTIRTATLHAVGDSAGNIATGAQNDFAGKLAGYDVINGLYSLSGTGNDLYLTIDAQVCAAAYRAMDGRAGCVGVYNYQTGDILCMVSTPSYDPENPVTITEDNEAQYEGVYINRFLSASYTPGSIFKLVTAAAAIDNIDGIFQRSFKCEGSLAVGEEAVTCPTAHGTLDFEQALAWSCNTTFARIAMELGPEIMEKYAEDAYVRAGVTIDGIRTAAGHFDLNGAAQADLAWAGVGQYTTLVNPAAFMTFLGAVANDGVPVMPRLIDRVRSSGGFPASLNLKKNGRRVMSAGTAGALADMMHNNVVINYGEGNYPVSDLCAKSGTAEVGGGQTPHAWFVGFVRDTQYPLAFVVLVENGGSGSGVAGTVASKVLGACVQAMDG